MACIENEAVSVTFLLPVDEGRRRKCTVTLAMTSVALGRFWAIRCSLRYCVRLKLTFSVIVSFNTTSLSTAQSKVSRKVFSFGASIFRFVYHEFETNFLPSRYPPLLIWLQVA